MTNGQIIRAYHKRTQHHLHRYAQSLGRMDWATQPSPFRRYEGATTLQIPLARPDGQPRYPALFQMLPAPARIDAASVGRLFQDSLALSAWKEYRGTRWALRVNPSSGNLHPTEAYLLSGPVPGLTDAPSLCHYAPETHGLERRATLPSELWTTLAAGLPEDALWIGLTSIPWRESWKYGERAYRYCMHDLGHALGAIGFAAAALGWRTALLPVPDQQLSLLLGIDDQHGPEAEHPGLLLVVHPDAEARPAFVLSPEVLDRLRDLPRQGVPAALSKSHHAWPVIDDAIAATRMVAPVATCFDRPPQKRRHAAPVAPDGDSRALFHQRRSAVAMDGKTGIGILDFVSMLDRVVDPTSPPLQMLPWRSRIHLVLFVHRVEGLPPGIYCLVRGGQDREWLKGRMRPEFLWETPSGVPMELPLHLLVPIDCRDAARRICCHQDIAADSAFAVAMLAEFGPTLDTMGPVGWRLLHVEAGAVGQLLYLEAEAIGRRATGIGCFFDSAVQELLGITSDDLRTVYHFTTGGALEDDRLQTLPAYPDPR